MSLRAACARLVASVSFVAIAVAATVASAQTIASRSWSTPYDGVRLLEGTTTSPTTRFYALHVGLCADYVHVAATAAPSSRRSAAAWGTAAGVQVAVNGDFYRTDRTTPTVYGQAAGGGAAWPSAQTGEGSAWTGEWYYRNYGWIAFGPGWVDFNHTEWVKLNRTVTAGWSPSEVVGTLPPGTTALVSGFPELVIEGARYTCSSPTASGCFSDRSDMRQRHPRTAMGLTEDRRTFLLVVVDGRSTSSAGMYGTELAKLMEDLGAWQAFNLDGGGSSQMWVRSRGTINSPSDGSPRAVANHWGVFAGSGTGMPSTPSSCDPARYDDCFTRGDGTGCEELEAILSPAAHSLGRTTDLDGDGRADVCGRANAHLVCRLAGDDGSWEVADGFDLPALSDAMGFSEPHRYATIRTGDVNGDGLADVCARASDGVSCWASDGTGFGPPIAGPAITDEGGWSGPGYYSTITLADVDGDGRDDLCARTAASFDCWLATEAGFGDRAGGPSWGNDEGWNMPSRYGSIRMGDVDGDGRADVCGRAAEGMECWLSDGGSHTMRIVGPEWSDARGWGAVRFYSTIRLADVDGDRRADLCARSSTDLRCHLSEGDGFGDAIIVADLADTSGWNDHGNYATLRTGDVDADGAIDLCVRANAGIRCYAWNATGFDLFVGPDLSDDSGWDEPMYYATLRLADVTGDGRADLCARAADGLTCWPSTGRAFGAPIAGGIFADASGWSPPEHYATLRLAGPACTPEPESCNGADDDCDGAIDEDDACAGADGGGRGDGGPGRTDGAAARDGGSGTGSGTEGGCSCGATSSGAASALPLVLVLACLLALRRRHPARTGTGRVPGAPKIEGSGRVPR